MNESSIKVGVITDQTGPLSVMGIANANVAKMVIDDINAHGGLLGRQITLCLEDSATTDSVAEAKATKLVEQDKVEVLLGGIYSSTRQAIKRAAVVKGKKLYIYPEQYEGRLALQGGAAGSFAHTLRRTCLKYYRPPRWKTCTVALTITRPSATRSASNCLTGTTNSIPAVRCLPQAAPARACTGD